MTDYDALLVVSFGGPERPEDVVPFLENVTRGRNVPRERLEEVGEHYFLFGGKSPINDQNRSLIAAIEAEFTAQRLELPVYWGNRNWHPLLADTLARMRDDGVRRALGFVTSAYSSYSGCRQYREDLAAARAAVGDGAPEIDKVRVYYNHPGFVAPMAELTAQALAELPADVQPGARVVFTTHSVPRTMARHADYEVQTYEACRLVMQQLRVPAGGWDLVFNSRSGPPQVPWLEPDVNDHLQFLAKEGVPGVVVVPIGFVSDHLEVAYDLDVEARATAEEAGLAFVRASTVGSHPRFVRMVRELVAERTDDAPRLALGTRGPNHDFCPLDCCLTPGQEARAAVASAAPRSRAPAP